MSVEKERDISKSTGSTVVVMFCTVLSRLLGFVRVAVIGAVFGATGTADVLNTVFQIPNNLRKLLAEGALSSAFIPVFSSLIVKDPKLQSAKKLVRNLITFLFLLFLPLIFLSIVFARPIISLLLPFPEVWKVELSIKLFRWLIGYIVLVSVSSVLMGVLNSHGRFVIPALSPPIFSLTVISSIIIFSSQLGIFSVAIGVLTGGIAQIIFQLPVYFRLGYNLKPNFHFNNENFKKTLKLWLPVVASASIFAINQQVAIFFASGLEDGSTSALANAIIFWQLPFGVFSVSVITVLFPRMSRQSERKDYDGLRESLFHGIHFILLMMLPTTVLYLFLGREIIEVALQRYRFTAYGTKMASKVLLGYSFGFVSVGIFNFLQRYFYSTKDFRTPLLISIFVSVTDIILSLFLKETYLRVGGLAVANSVSFTLGFLVQILIIKGRINLGSIKGSLMLLIKALIALLPMTLILLFFKLFIDSFWTDYNSLQNFLALSFVIVVSVVSLLFMYYIMKIEIVVGFVNKIIKKKLGEE